jgi:hypothetical protein
MTAVALICNLTGADQTLERLRPAALGKATRPLQVTGKLASRMQRIVSKVE